MLEIAVHSLFEFGLWEGDFLIITEIERVDLVRQLLEPFGEKIFIEALPAEDILDFTLSRYKIMNIDICNRYQPIIYLDTDVVSDLPIHEYMKERAFKSHFDVVEQLFLGHTEDFYGKTLLELDGVGFGQSELGLSSGIFSFRNIVEQSEVFCLILKSATKAGEIFGRRHFRFFDQPFFNYVIYKTQPAISVQLSTFVKVHFSNSSFLTEPVCKGFVHFAGGVGNSSPKIKQMTYYVEVLRNDRTAK